MQLIDIVQKADLLSLSSKEWPFGLDFKQTIYYKSHFKVIGLIVLDAPSRQKLHIISVIFLACFNRVVKL